jgi:hypothetical protein
MLIIWTFQVCSLKLLVHLVRFAYNSVMVYIIQLVTV